MLLKSWLRQSLREDVGRHLGSRAVVEFEDPVLNLLPDEVMLNVNVFGTRVKLRVPRECNGGLIIGIEDRSRTVNRSRFVG